MKLKCETHGRRVMVLESETVIHRNDGTKCESDVVMGDMFFTPREVLDVTAMETNLSNLNNLPSKGYREWRSLFSRNYDKRIGVVYDW